MEIIRRLQQNENIPFDLLLLADENMQAINKYINDSEIYILEEAGRIIAVYVFKVIDNSCVEIKNIAVEINHQRQGIGTILLRDACNRAKGKGFSSILIGTGDVGYGQLRLYQREGFEIFDRKNNYFIENYPEPIYENGVQLKDMVMLKKDL